MSIISSNFNSEDTAKILKIPLSPSCPVDKMFWWPSKDGAYSVRSGYWLCKKVPSVMQGCDMNEVWKLIWSLKCPPKLHHFLWRACMGFLAVKKRLFYRHIVTEKSCSICNAPEESIIHATFECKAAAEIWAASPLVSQVSNAPASSFVERFLWCSKNLSKEELLSTATLAWASWHCRNKAIFEQVNFNAVDVARGWVHYVKESAEYAVKTARLAPVGNNATSTWHCPAAGMVKVNCDAHLGVRTGLGVVIRSEQGTILAAAIREVGAGWDVDAAEAATCRYGLQVARRLGFINVHLESDAAGVVNAVKSKAKGFSPIFLLYDDINSLASCFSSFCFSHVKRAGNTLAHSVARWETRGCNECVSLGLSPKA